MVNQTYTASSRWPDLYKKPCGGEKAGPWPSGRFTAEQHVSGGAVHGGFVAVRLDPRDFGFEQSDPFAQLAYRIRIEAFRRKQASGVDLGPGEVIFHCGAESDAMALLSTWLHVRAVRVAKMQQGFVNA